MKMTRYSVTEVAEVAVTCGEFMRGDLARGPEHAALCDGP